MKKIWLGLLLLCCLSGQVQAQKDWKVTEEEVLIPGLAKEQTFLFLADLHILVNNEEVGQEYRETVLQREALFVNEERETSAAFWPRLAEQIDAFAADGLLLGGDMVDFASQANLQCLKEGLDHIRTPLMYVRADHDYGVWYDTMEKEEARELHRQTAESKSVYVMDRGDFLVVGVNNNTSQISAHALEKLQTIFSRGLPVILVLHVPLASQMDEQLSQKSRAAWQNRVLLWGTGAYYEPDENTQAFLDLVFAEESPVVEVLSGHLHFSYSGPLTETLRQYVAGPAYAGELTLLRVHG